MANGLNPHIFNLNGKHLEVLQGLVKKGYFGNKTEVVKAGLLEIGEKYGIIPTNGDNAVKFKESKGGKRRRK